jgi:hypothetical protein
LCLKFFLFFCAVRYGCIKPPMIVKPLHLAISISS